MGVKLVEFVKSSISWTKLVYYLHLEIFMQSYSITL